MAFCPTCGTQIADGTTCPKCAAGTATEHQRSGTRRRRTYRQRGRRAGLSDHHSSNCVSGDRAVQQKALRPLPCFSIYFLFCRLDRSRIYACPFIGHIPFLGWATLFLWPLVSLVLFVILLVLALKAYQGQMFKLPVIGDMAEQQAGA